MTATPSAVMACKPATAAAMGRRYPRTARGYASGEDDYLQ
jgi:hypothetical protein